MKFIARFSEVAGKSGKIRKKSLEWLRKRLEKLGSVEEFPSFFIIEGDFNPEVLAGIPGITEYGKVCEVRADIDEIKRAVVGLELREPFYIRVRRRGEHDFTSLDVARSAGRELVKRGLRVDFRRGRKVSIEIVGDRAFIFLPEKGLGGIPPVIKRAVVLVSGSRESRLALILSQARGFITLPLTLYTQKKPSFPSNFIDATELVEALYFAKPGFDGLLFKTAMYRLADLIARKMEGVVITGEVMGKNRQNDPRILGEIEKAAGVVPYRPLAFFSMEEVREKAKKLGVREEKIEYRFSYIHAGSGSIEEHYLDLALDPIIRKMASNLPSQP